MQESGLASDQAFDFLHFVNEPINESRGDLRVLGLYYPERAHDPGGYIPPSTIMLPEDASYSTLLHELGHRHGHFYHNDISEGYAERWRDAHEYLNPDIVTAEVAVAQTEPADGRSRMSKMWVPQRNIVAVAATTPGACFIRNIKFLYPWNSSIVVDSVPVGERFDFVVDYQAENTTPELGPIAGFWSMSIVFWDDENDLAGYYFKNTIITGATRIADNAARIANAYQLRMPNHDVVLHLNMFINDDMTPAQQYPNRADWAKLKV